MKSAPLETPDPHVRLVEPVVDRDAPLGVEWLQGDVGRSTLKLMGVVGGDNKPASLDEERERVQSFIDRDDQLNWMIQYDEQVVGSIWVDLGPSDYLKSPSVHIMIGDPEVRGKGVGTASTSSVISHLSQTGYKSIYSRYQLINTGSAKLLHDVGFQPDGEPYTDSDGLEYQNVALTDL